MEWAAGCAAGRAGNRIWNGVELRGARAAHEPGPDARIVRLGGDRLGGKQEALPGALPRPPVALSTAHIEWIKDAVAMQGTANIANGVQAQFDVAWLPGSFDLRRLALSDTDSDATLRLQRVAGGRAVRIQRAPPSPHARTESRAAASDACHVRWELPRIHRPRGPTPLER